MQIVPSLREKFIEEESVKLMKDTEEKKRVQKLKDIEEAKRRLERANKLYAKQEYAKAVEELEVARSLNPGDDTISVRIDKIKEKIKEGQKEEVVKNLEGYFQSGIRLYRQDNPQAARQEFERMLELTASPQEK
jgi:tetratricopeptide (TPR) repeat protein